MYLPLHTFSHSDLSGLPKDRRFISIMPDSAERALLCIQYNVHGYNNANGQLKLLNTVLQSWEYLFILLPLIKLLIKPASDRVSSTVDLNCLAEIH